MRGMARKKSGDGLRTGVKPSRELLAYLERPWEQARIINAAVWTIARRRPDDRCFAALHEGVGHVLQRHENRRARFRIRVVYGPGGYRLCPRVAESNRIRSLVKDLAIQYDRALGTPPGRSDAGPFFRLVREACRALGEQPPSSVRHMLRHIDV